jgi:hypothetical protein
VTPRPSRIVHHTGFVGPPEHAEGDRLEVFFSGSGSIYPCGYWHLDEIYVCNPKTIRQTILERLRFFGSNTI